METGIHADQNFYSRRPSSSDEQLQLQLQRQLQRQLQQHRQHTYSSPPLPDFEQRSPHIHPKIHALTTQNLAVVSLDGSRPAALNGGPDRDPDDFYREYRGVQTPTGSYTDLTSPNMATSTDARPTPSSLRSNGNGSTPKYPTLPLARTAQQPSYRSTSSPLDNRTAALGTAKPSTHLNGYSNSRQPNAPSVKDLLKQFDQNNEPSGSAVRKPPMRINTKEVGGTGYTKDRVGYQARSTNNQNVPSVSRAGSAAREPVLGRVKSPANSRTTQRTRFVEEDTHSSNTLSIAARTTRARHAVSGGSFPASKSTTTLSPTSPTVHQLQGKRPLFGEIIPIGHVNGDIGYGISRAATRRISDSSLHPSWAHQRGRPEVEDFPSSPTAWYRGVNPGPEGFETNKPLRQPGHNRSHSDFLDTKVNTMNGVSPSFPTITSPTTFTTQQSRLPIPASRRHSNSSDSVPSSHSSTRASSPFAAKAVSSGKLRRPSISTPWNSGIGQSSTPANATKTPNHHSPRGKIRGSTEPNPNNASLKAYISAPLPMISPPLRSSRPRQHVSSASTAISNTKIVDRAGSPQHIRTGMKLTRTGGETTRASGDAEERKKRNIPNVQLTAQDFAARRDLIRRAYTKSIHESEQKQIRADNLRRLNERHGHSQSSTLSQATEIVVDEPQRPATPPAVEQLEPLQITPPEPLHIDTSFQISPSAARRAETVPVGEDSPTLGIPGSFVDDEEPPQSAISCATGTTEIENEPQTEAPRLSRMTSRPDGFSSHVTHLDGQLSPEQAFFGMQYTEMDEESIQIMLEATTPSEEPIPEATPTNNEFSKETLPIEMWRQDAGNTPKIEEHIPVFASILTMASPPRTLRNNSEANTSFISDNAYTPASEDTSIMFDANVLSVSPSESQTTPEFINEEQFVQVPEKSDVPKLELPVLRTALRPESFVDSDQGHDYLHTPLTDIEYESSDGAVVINGSILAKNSEAYYSHAHDAQASPRTSLSSNRSSWTDYAFETTDQYSYQAPYPSGSPLEVERAPTPPPKELRVSPIVPPKDDVYSPQPSSRVSHFSQSQRPPLPTENGLGLGIRDTSAGFGTVTVTTPAWLEHSLPLHPPVFDESPLAAPTRTPPPPSLYNRRPPSSLYDSSQNGASRNAESRRVSDDLYSIRASNSTPRSSTQISFDDAATDKSSKMPSVPVVMTEEENEAAEKNRKRLFHRKMVIKELIDTESVYLKDMNVVEEIYKGTAEACPNLESGDVKTIFRNTDEIVQFSTMFLDELKSAASSVYSPRSLKSRQRNTQSTAGTSVSPLAEDRLSVAATLTDDTDEHKDRQTFIGANFAKHLKRMQVIYTEFLKNSEIASTRLAVLQDDGAVKVWLSECNLVAKDLTQAWDLDALLVKPVQRITRYQLLLVQIKESTPVDHPDFLALQAARAEISSLLANIDALKKRIHMVGQIVGRKRKESDVRSGLAKAFGRREKLATNPNRPQDDVAYLKANERFSDDYLRLQVVLRDVEFYTRETTSYVIGFLRYLSSMELMMRVGASPAPEIESKWVRFNLSMRDVETVALEDHVNKIRKKVIEPFEQIIALYGPPNLAMKKRYKRRLDYEKFLQLKGQGKKIDEKLTVLVSEYEALNETLKLELPKLSSQTEIIGNVCCIQLVHLQAEWWNIWQTKLRMVLEESQVPKEVADIVDMFNRDYKYTEARLSELAIVNGTFGSGAITRASTHSTIDDNSRPSDLSVRSRGPSIHSEISPVLPITDFSNRLSGQYAFSPFSTTAPGLPQFAYQPQAYSNGHSRAGSNSPATPDTSSSQKHPPPVSARPNTGRSFTSDGATRMSTDYNTQHRRESGSTYSSAAHHVDGPPMSGRPHSGIFHSAMPMPDGPDESHRSSRASSRDRNTSSNFNVLYLAASLFEFNISATKQEAGYPYLTYQAGEIFDVIAEKGELWLAKNQDDLTEQVGWIWSKHFARLATD